MPEYKVRIGMDLSGLQKSFRQMKSSFAGTAGEMKKRVAAISSDLKTKLSGGFRQASSASKLSEKSMVSSSQGIQVGLDGMLESMKLVGGIAKDMLIGFVNASPAASAAMAQIDFSLTQIKKSLGDALAPALDMVAEKIEIFSDFMTNLDPAIQLAIVSSIAFVAAGVAVVGIITAISAIGLPLIGLFAAIGTAVALLSIAWQNNFLGIRDTVMLVVDQLKPIFEALMGTFITEASAMFASLKDSFGGTSGSLQELGKMFVQIFNILKPLLDVLIKVFFILLKNSIESIINKFKLWIGIVTGIFKLFAALVKGDWAGALEAFRGIFDAVIQYIQNEFQRIINLFVGLFNVFGIDLVSIWNNIWNGLKRGISTFINYFKGKFDILQNLFAKFANKVDSIGNKIKKIFAEIGDFFAGMWTSVKDGITSFPNIIKNIMNLPIKTINDTVIGKINDFLSKTKGISVAGVKPFSWIQTIPTIPLLHYGGVVGKSGDYRLQRGEGVLSAQQMSAIGGIVGLRAIGRTSTVNTNNTFVSEIAPISQQGSNETNVTIQQVVLSNDIDLDKFVNALRKRDFDDFGSRGFSMMRY